MDLATIGFRAETSGLVRARSDLDRLADQGERTEKRVSGAMGGIGKAFAAIASAAGVGSLASKLIETERSTGILTASLKVATGSAQNATEAFGAIQRLATQLPESVDSVSNAFIKLTNMGLDPSEAAIKSYSNTAAAMGKDLNQMIEAVADAATGEFERLKEFGIKSKQQGDQVSFTFRGITTTVAKEADAITGYLRQIGDVTFAGAATERMKTLDGAISNLGDTWDGLFREINKAGVGKLIADGVRMATSAIQSLSDFIESGKAAGAIEAFKIKFQVVGDVAVAGFNVMLDAAKGFYGAWYMMSNEFYGLFGESTDSMIDKFVDGFVNLPENIKAFVQIMAIEIAALVEKAKVYGGQIAWHMNPTNWFSEAPDISGAIDSLNMIREESIAIALEAREASIKSFQDQAKAVSEMTLATENAGEVLGKYGIKATEAAAATAEIPKQLKTMQDIVEQAEFDDLFQGMEGYDFTENIEGINAQKEELDALIESVDNFGGAWSNTGNTIADALGSMSDQMDNYISRIDAVQSKELELAEAKKKAFSVEDIARITAAEKKMAEERTRANVAGYRSMTNAAASMFRENSRARKALTAVEQAMTAVELALSLKRGLAAAQEAVANQGKGDPYTAWARMAAMAASMAGLGYAVSGGGGGGGQSAQQIQESQGSGSVLGSNDKSASLLNAIESFSDIGIDQLVELRQIRESLSVFKGGIAQLSIGVAASGLTAGKYVNFDRQYVGDIIDRGGLKTRGSRIQDIAGRIALEPLQGQISQIFGYIQDSANTALSSLGLVADNPVWAFISDIGKVSFKDMTGEEIQAELNAIFSQQADMITEFVIPAMKDYQLMGEGLFETLARVAKEQAVFNDTIKNIGLDLGDLSAIMRVDVAQSVIQLMGGLEDFADKTQEYFEAFFSEQERMDMLTASLSETFSALNLSLPQSRDEFRSLVEGLDLTTDAGQRMFANLMELVPGIDQYIGGLEKAADAQLTAANKMAEAEAAAAKAAEQAQARINSQRNNLEVQLLQLQGNIEEATARRRELELAGIDESLQGLQKEIYAQQDANAAMEAAKKLAEDQAKAAQEAAQAQIEAAEDAARAQIQAQEDATRAAEQAAEEQRRLIEGTQDAITSAIRALRGESEKLNDIDRQRAKNTLNAALAAAQAGQSIIGFAGLDDALLAVQKIDKSQFQSAEAYQREVGQTLSILDRLGGYAGIAPKTPIPTTSPVIPMGTVTQAQTTQQLAMNVQNMESQILDLTKRIEKNTKTNADLMQRWEAIGMPSVRA